MRAERHVRSLPGQGLRPYVASGGQKSLELPNLERSAKSESRGDPQRSVVRGHVAERAGSPVLVGHAKEEEPS